MTKKEFIDSVQSSLDEGTANKKEIGAVLDALFNALKAELAANESAAWPGFGTFKVRERAAREGKNPRTGEAMKIPASRTVGFTPAAALKRRLNP